MRFGDLEPGNLFFLPAQPETYFWYSARKEIYLLARDEAGPLRVLPFPADQEVEQLSFFWLWHAYLSQDEKLTKLRRALRSYREALEVLREQNS